MNFFRIYRYECLGALLCILLGTISGLSVSSGDSSWYAQSLNKPAITPPSWIFGPVWTFLYGMMGIVLGKIWAYHRKRSDLLVLFFLQLVLNVVWSPLFFGVHLIQWALVDVIVLFLVLLVFLYRARGLSGVFFLWFPYVVWIGFACVLNYKIYLLN